MEEKPEFFCCNPKCDMHVKLDVNFILANPIPYMDGPMKELIYSDVPAEIVQNVVSFAHKGNIPVARQSVLIAGANIGNSMYMHGFLGKSAHPIARHLMWSTENGETMNGYFCTICASAISAVTGQWVS